MEGRYWVLKVKCLDDNGMEIKEKNCNIKSYIFSLDNRGRGILKLTCDDFKTAVYDGIYSCFSDNSCTVFRALDNTTFVVSDG